MALAIPTGQLLRQPAARAAQRHWEGGRCATL